jgi:hypothetical protein
MRCNSAEEVTEARSRQCERPVQVNIHATHDRLVRGDQGKSRRVRFVCLKVFSAAAATLLLSLVCIHDASAEGGCGPRLSPWAVRRMSA